MNEDDLDKLYTAQSELSISSRYESQTGEKDTADVTPGTGAATELIQNPDEEMAILEHEMKKLEEEEKLLVTSQKVQEMRKAISEKKTAIKKLRSRTPSSESKLDKYESNKTKQTKSKSKSVKKSAKQIKIKPEKDLDCESDIKIDINSLEVMRL